MNTSFRYKFLLIFTACAGLPAGGLLAQAPASPSPGAATTPSVSVPADSSATGSTATEGPGKRHGMKDRLAELTPEERQKLRAAHEKAMQDPAVKAAEATKETDRKGYHETVRAAMLRADPSVQTILDKMKEERGGKKEF